MSVVWKMEGRYMAALLRSFIKISRMRKKIEYGTVRCQKMALLTALREKLGQVERPAYAKLHQG